MATAEQLKALIRAHMNDDSETFKTISLQIAAYEAKLGHTSCARDIKALVQDGKREKKKIISFEKNVDALRREDFYVNLSDLVLSEFLEEKIIRIIDEFRQKELLRKNGLKNRSKILLTGNPGTGKTMTASVISTEIHLPLYVVQTERIVTKYMGETSVKLRQVFDYIEEFPGVYLFDEFDALGSDRSLDNDVGEMRRILNSFLQFLENEDSFSLVIAATNNPGILDKALFRRFDDVLEYSLPDEEQISRLLKNKLEGYFIQDAFDPEVVTAANGLSHADIAKACEETLKSAILNDTKINKQLLLAALQDRSELYHRQEA